MTASEVLARPSAVGRVLLVDDRKDNLLALEAVLEPLRFDLLKAFSGIEALRLLLEEDIATILLDVQMPEMDGFETAALVRSRAAMRHIPIVFLTAISPDPDLQLRGYGIGAIDYICKPFDPTVLRAKVRALVEMSSELRCGEGFPAPLSSRAGAPPSRHDAAGAGQSVIEVNAMAAFCDLERLFDDEFALDPCTPQAVRDAVRAALRRQPAEVVESVSLLVSELATNAVLHASSRARVRLDLGPGVVRAEVVDTSPLAPSPRRAAPSDEHGRGLQLVRMLAARCGYTKLPDGKSVWFELDLPIPPRQ